MAQKVPKVLLVIAHHAGMLLHPEIIWISHLNKSYVEHFILLLELFCIESGGGGENQIFRHNATPNCFVNSPHDLIQPRAC